MLNLYRSSHLNELVEKLLNRLNNCRGKPLDSRLIVVQNYGMEQWLKMYIARRQGIAANLTVKFPAEQIWELFRLVDPSIQNDTASHKELMHFAIFDIIISENNKKSFAPLHSYVEADSTLMQEIRAWKLSYRIADLFDRYLVYRPERVMQWQKGNLQTGNKSEQWQAALWRMLAERLKYTANGGGDKHRAEMQKNFLEAIKNGNLNVAQLPRRITIFGVSVLAPIFLETFIQLSNLIDIDFYWFDSIHSVDNDNVLVESWGGPGKDFLQLFHHYAENDKTTKNQFRVRNFDSDRDFSTTMLGRLQNSILSENNSEKAQNISADRSIQVHSCHSLLREVEVLYDQLLALFDKNPDLNHDDIVIICTDMERYAPLVEAVFGQVEQNLPRIPFSIAAERRSSSLRIDKAFLNILDLLQSRFKVSDVMELLHMPVIKERMKIDHEDISKLERWIEENNIRWGIDGNFKEQLGLPKDNHFTWQAGLSRMMLGYAMHQEDKKTYNGLLPYKAISSTDEAELLGRAFELLNKLFDLQSKIMQLKTVGSWASLLNGIIDNLLPKSEKYAEEIIILREVIDELSQHSAAVNFDRMISFSIIRSYLSQKLDLKKTSGYFGYGVTFSSPAAVRCIPFKMIGMLGMDEASFPRNDTPVEFDLMKLNPILGDPDKAEDDRYLFLNTLLSAQQYLYISYAGQSNQKNVRSSCSVLVSELVNVLEEQFGISKEALVHEHPLQPFSPLYFRSDEPGLFSYSRLHFNTAKKLQNAAVKDSEIQNVLFEKLEPAENKTDTIELETLISFYQHPSKYLLQNVMGIYLPADKKLEKHRELFKLSGLDKYKINQELLDEVIAENALKPMQSIFEARDMLPVKFWGERAFHQQVTETKRFYSAIASEIKDRQEPIEFDLRIIIDSKPIQLKGKLCEIYAGRLLLNRFGRFRAKDAIEWWIKHLVYSAIYKNEEAHISHYYGYDEDKGKVTHHTLAPVNAPTAIIEGLAKKYRLGLQSPFPFFPETSYTFAETLNEAESNIENALFNARKKWKGNRYSYNAESENSYNNIIFKNYNLLPDSTFTDLSKYIYNPYLNALRNK